MQLKSIDGTITALSGRIGNFIFRTRNGKIHAFYKPKASSTQSRINTESISDQLREITNALNLQIIES